MKIKALAGAAVLLLAAAACKPAYQNPNADPQKRAEDIVSRMTLEEKVSLMQHASPAIPRLGIKQYNWWNEALHGVGRAGLATVFPQPIGMGASFDDDMVYRVFDAVSDEARAKNTQFKQEGDLNIYQCLTFWTPNVNIFRDPRWGRGHETYGEDPYLTSRLGVQVVNGLQGPSDSKYAKLFACAKHFAVHSGPEWNRHTFNAKDISDRDLYETYLPAFQTLVQEGDVKQVMCAYNRYEDDPCCGSDKLLQQILRNDWNYQHIVVSDCWAINDFYQEGHHETEPDPAHSAAKAVRTGTDVECGSTYANLVEAVEQGLIDETTIDRSVIRLMKGRFELGEMDDDKLVEWTKIPYSVVDSKEHKALALEAALKSMVLLKNDGTLPLKKNMKVALLGPNAADSLVMWGNYNGYPSKTITLLEALQSRYPEAQFIYDQGCDLTADVAIVSLINDCMTEDGHKGFSATYWNSLRPEGDPAAKVYIDTQVNLSAAGATVFAPGVNLENFCGVYETVFTPKTSGKVAFSYQVQGTLSMEIDGETVFRGRNNKNAFAYSMDVKAGKSYKIKVNFGTTDGRVAAVSFNFGHQVPLDINAVANKVKDADVIIYAGGIAAQLEGEEMPVSIDGFKGGDRTKIELPKVQTALLERLAKTGKPLVYVNYSGSAIAITRESELCNAVLQAWYPGQAGGEAIAQVLTGEYNPAGRLPLTFYKSSADLPDFMDYNMTNRTYRYFKGEPLYPFGFGLSYTTFAYGDATLSTDSYKAGSSMTIEIPVSNTGSIDGEEVVQVYLRRVGDNEGPSHALRAFRRVNVAKGATANVSFKLDDSSFQWFDTTTSRNNIIPGDYELLYGPSSDLASLKVAKLTIVK